MQPILTGPGRPLKLLPPVLLQLFVDRRESPRSFVLSLACLLGENISPRGTFFKLKLGLHLRVLSIDSGEMRGMATFLMLEKLDNMTGANTLKMFNLIVGTSIGAIIARLMGISCIWAREGLELYMEMGMKIFNRYLVEWGVGALIQHQSYYEKKVL